MAICLFALNFGLISSSNEVQFDLVELLNSSWILLLHLLNPKMRLEAYANWYVPIVQNKHSKFVIELK